MKTETITATRIIGVKLELNLIDATHILSALRQLKKYHKDLSDQERIALIDIQNALVIINLPEKEDSKHTHGITPMRMDRSDCPVCNQKSNIPAGYQG